MGFADLHIHSIHSYDGTAPVTSILRRAKELELSVIAITDHDEIAGSLKAVDLAPAYGIEVIPAIEITTAEGDLLAYNITKRVAPGLPLIETILQVGDLGGFCIAPHPMAGGIGMKSLNGYSILRAVRHPQASKFLIAIETYNATSIDTMSNHYARVLANRLEMPQVASSDAHILSTIGLATTEFEGHTAKALLRALRKGRVKHNIQKKWNAVRILGSWATHYVGSALTRFANATG